MEEEFEIYGGFAAVYDLFMGEIPYDEWFLQILHLLRKYGVSRGNVVDLACGTGQMTKRLIDAGYEAVGVDLSPDMLAVAGRRCGPGTLLICQDMRELELHRKAEAVVCVCDGMNYMCSEEDLGRVFAGVNASLEKGGIFLFDMKTEYFYREVLGSQVITENREEASYIWENVYDEESGINEYLLTVYDLVDDARDLFVRTDELHRQRPYSIGAVKRCMEEQGLSCLEVLEAYGGGEPRESSERLCFVGKRVR